MTHDDFLKRLPVRTGHFRLESGYHSDTWLTLDALFVSPREIAPLVAALADRLRTHDVSVVCGPLLGGAFLAQAVATRLDVEFFYSEPAGGKAAGMFEARYRLPAELARRISDQRVAIVDDVIGAGSSVRATAAAVTAAGGTVAAVGTLLTLGTVGIDHFSIAGIPLEALARQPFTMWPQSSCPYCEHGMPLEDPSS